MGWTRRAPPQPAASGGVLSSPGLFSVPRSAKYAGLPPLDHPARGHSPDEIRRLAARAASPRCRSSSGNSLCGQNSAGFRESARPFKGIIYDDISEFESYHLSHAVWSPPLDSALSARGKDLERDGLIRIERVASDRRAKELHLTKAGEKRLRAALKGWSQAQARFETVFGAKRAADLRALLRAAVASQFAPAEQFTDR